MIHGTNQNKSSVVNFGTGFVRVCNVFARAGTVKFGGFSVPAAGTASYGLRPVPGYAYQPRKMARLPRQDNWNAGPGGLGLML